MQGKLIIVQDKTGTLSLGAHAGSYNGQDAYNDMLVNDGLLHRERTTESVIHEQEGRSVELYARPTNSDEGGVT